MSLVCISEVRFLSTPIAQLASLDVIVEADSAGVLRSLAKWEKLVADFGAIPARRNRPTRATACISEAVHFDWFVLDQELADWALLQKNGFSFGGQDYRYREFDKNLWELIIRNAK